jgi:hypothetical protein
MTLIRRLIALEAELRPPDQRAREEAISEAARRVINAVNALAAGLPPSCPVEHALVRHQLDIGAAIAELLEHRRARAR